MICSRSVITAVAFSSGPVCCTGAEAIAVVVPGIATPVTGSLYVAVATSFRFVVPAGTVMVCVSIR